jgi:hypothetical protein
MSLRLDIRGRDSQGQDRRAVVLWFPVILAWIVLFALMIAALPFLLLAALATARGRPGMRLLLVYPVVFTAIGALSGLRIDVDGRGKDKVFISLD